MSRRRATSVTVGHYLDPEEVARREAERRSARNLAIIVGILILLVVGAVDLIVNEALNGDWRCAFIKCVKIVDVTPAR